MKIDGPATTSDYPTNLDFLNGHLYFHVKRDRKKLLANVTFEMVHERSMRVERRATKLFAAAFLRPLWKMFFLFFFFVIATSRELRILCAHH